MQKKKRGGLKPSEILARVDAKVKDCVSWTDSKLSREVERVTGYYNSKLPVRASEGHSSYVSTDVYDSVEAMKSQLLETFAAGEEIVKFPPQGEDDVEKARIATAYVPYVIFRQNPGYEIFRDVIHDGLTARVGISKVFWETKTDHVEEEFEGLGYDDVMGLASQEDIPDLDADADDQDMFSGKLTRAVDRSQVTIHPVPFDEFLVSSRATSVQAADMVAHRTPKTKAELIEMGYDRKKVEKLSADASLNDNAVAQARNEPTDAFQGTDDPIQDELDRVWFTEAYVKMNMKTGDGVRLYKVCYASDVLFSHEEVDRAPFVTFTPLPVPHVFYGNNFAARVMPTQNARTVLTRAVLDHSARTINPRWGVVKGGLMNPREMLDNRQGGVVNLTRADAVKALEQPVLNPFVFNILEMLKANKEESTGISALSQGISKDAISTQNSQGMVQDLVSLSQQRQKIVARNFAVGYLIPLYLEVYRLVLENEKKEKIVEIAGNWENISVQSWTERLDCKVSLHLGYGERDKETQKYSSVYSMLASDPAIAPMFGPEERHALITDGLKSAGLDNHAKYLKSPDKVQPAPPDPKEVAELKVKQDTAQAALLQAQAALKKADQQGSEATFRAQLDALTKQVETLFRQGESDRMDMETANRVNVSQRETAVLEQQANEPKEVAA